MTNRRIAISQTNSRERPAENKSAAKIIADMATTVTGTDTQFNYFSISGGKMAIGDGGPDPVQVAALPSPAYFQPANPGAYDAILKISDGTAGLAISGASISQGHEDSLNLNNAASDITVAGGFSSQGNPGLRVITVKGGCKNVTISGTIHQHGTDADVVLGDWSDENAAASSVVNLSGLYMVDESRVSVIVGHCAWPKLGPQLKVDWAGTVKIKAYWWFKRAVRAVLRIPIGQSGPTWLS
jgi:hypothetical protein